MFTMAQMEGAHKERPYYGRVLQPTDETRVKRVM